MALPDKPWRPNDWHPLGRSGKLEGVRISIPLDHVHFILGREVCHERHNLRNPENYPQDTIFAYYNQ